VPSPRLKRWVTTVAFVSLVLAVGAVPSRADWQEPIDLSPVGTPSGVPCETGRPSVAASRDGSFLIAWQRKLDAQSNDNTLIEGRRIDRDGTVGPLLQLSDAPANLGTVATAVGPDGAGIVVWHRQPAGACGVAPGPILLDARRVGADGSMGPVTSVTEPSDKALDTSVVVHRSGDVTVAWVDQIGFDQAVLKVRQLPATGPPGPVSKLTPTLGTTEEVKLVVDQHDRTLAVWNQHGILQAQWLSPDGDPLPGVIDGTPVDDTSAELDVGIAANGQARVTWTRFSPSPIAILMRTIGADGTLGPIDVAADGQDRPLGGRVAVSPSGAAALVWFTSPSDPAAHDVAFGRTLSPTGALAPAVPLSGPGSGVDMMPHVSLADNGAAVAAWQRSLGETGVVEGASFSAGGAEGPATQLSQPAQIEPFPDLDGNPKGDAVAAWGQQTDGGNAMKIQAAQFCRSPGNGNPKRSPCRRAGKPSSSPGAGAARRR
jgi:hypothetical protein